MRDTEDTHANRPARPVFKKNWRFYAGITCFILSFILPAFGVIVPKLGLSQSLTLAVIGVLLVGGPEAMLVLAALFLGKDGLNYYKQMAWGILKRPAGAFRYYLCVAMMMISSIIPWWLYGYVPQWMPVDSQFRIYFIGGCDALFVFSFIMAGPEFWDKFIRLLKWEGMEKTQPNTAG
jgi:hypothetical protein